MYMYQSIELGVHIKNYKDNIIVFLPSEWKWGRGGSIIMLPRVSILCIYNLLSE